MKLKVEVKGIEEVAKKVKELDDKLKKKVIGSASRKAARPLVAAAKANVPVSNKPHHRYSKGKIVATYYPGNLKGSIMFFQSKKSTLNNPLYYVGPRVGGGNKNDGWYGHFVEYGTVKDPAQPYMRPAYESTKGVVLGVLGEEILSAVERFK